MRSDPTTFDDEVGPSARTDSSEPIAIETHDFRYLDLSGDGVPDAVEHVIQRAHLGLESGNLDTIEEAWRLEFSIGIDGEPGGVSEHTTVFMLGESAGASRRGLRQRAGLGRRS